MVDATLSRGATSVTFHIWQEAGNLAIARDVGKPELKVQEVSRETPRSADLKSGLDQLTVLGVLTGPDAYADADTIAEDLIKPHSGGVPLNLDLTGVTGFDTVFEVGVPSANAYQCDYVPGRKDRVDISLTVPIVSDTIG